MSNMTNAEIQALADPLANRAEIESSKMPPSVDMPRGFTWNEAVTKEAARIEALWEKWARANNALAEQIEEHRAAQEADEIALKKAAREGATAHPGHKATAKAREALEWALTVCIVAREEVAREHQTGMLQKLMEQSVNGCIDEARYAVDRVAKDTTAVIDITRQRFREINQARAVAAEMVRWIAGVKDIRVDSTYAATLPEVKLPDGFQARMNWADGVLERIDAKPRTGQ